MAAPFSRTEADRAVVVDFVQHKSFVAVLAASDIGTVMLEVAGELEGLAAAAGALVAVIDIHHQSIAQSRGEIAEVVGLVADMISPRALCSVEVDLALPPGNRAVAVFVAVVEGCCLIDSEKAVVDSLEDCHRGCWVDLIVQRVWQVAAKYPPHPLLRRKRCRRRDFLPTPSHTAVHIVAEEVVVDSSVEEVVRPAVQASSAEALVVVVPDSSCLEGAVGDQVEVACRSRGYHEASLDRSTGVPLGVTSSSSFKRMYWVSERGESTSKRECTA